MADEGPKSLKTEEIEKHNTKESLYLMLHGNVHDATNFYEEHPGGGDLLLDFAGQDATEAFEDVGHSSDAREVLKSLLIGTVEDGAPKSSNETSKPAQPSSPPKGPDNPPLSNFAYLIPLFFVLTYLWHKYIGFSGWVLVKIPDSQYPSNTLDPRLVR